MWIDIAKGSKAYLESRMNWCEHLCNDLFNVDYTWIAFLKRFLQWQQVLCGNSDNHLIWYTLFSLWKKLNTLIFLTTSDPMRQSNKLLLYSLKYTFSTEPLFFFNKLACYCRKVHWVILSNYLKDTVWWR